MSSRIDLTGKTFYEWTLIEWIPPSLREYYEKDYIGKCSCGIIRPVSSSGVKAGKSKSCGHLKSNFNSIKIGEKYGKIIPIEQLTNKYGNPIQKYKYKCKCACGNIVIFPAKSIGKKKNCGCNFIEDFDKLEDITDNLYGLLTVVKLSEKKDKYNKSFYWDCVCKCGNKCTVSKQHLLSGHTKSCGCLKSYGEQIVSEFLRENNVYFKQQVKLPEIRDINPLPFDFGIYKDNKLVGLIEVQGEQHYNTDLFFSSDKLLLHDKIKQEKTKEMNISLLILDYSKGQDNTDFSIIKNEILKFLEVVYEL